MTRILTPWTIIVLFGCSNSSDNDNRQENNNSQIHIRTVDTLPGAELEKLLPIDIRKKLGEKYSGQLQYYTLDDTLKFLHGQFFLSYADSGNYFNQATNIYEDAFYITQVNYSGQFKDNKRHGKFIEELLHDDGIDLYSKWTVTIEFDNDNCTFATFFGAIGHIMPETSYKFQSLDTCSFDRVVNLAWSEWKKEYERQKNAR